MELGLRVSIGRALPHDLGLLTHIAAMESVSLCEQMN
jgi:hypothetical protein